jgi:hypothetical protein
MAFLFPSILQKFLLRQGGNSRLTGMISSAQATYPQPSIPWEWLLMPTGTWKQQKVYPLLMYWQHIELHYGLTQGHASRLSISLQNFLDTLSSSHKQMGALSLWKHWPWIVARLVADSIRSVFPIEIQYKYAWSINETCEHEPTPSPQLPISVPLPTNPPAHPAYHFNFFIPVPV